MRRCVSILSIVAVGAILYTMMGSTWIVGKIKIYNKKAHGDINNNGLTLDAISGSLNVSKQIRENKQIEKIEHLFRKLEERLVTQLTKKEVSLVPNVDKNLPWIYAITPTYSRITQKADLVRLSQTLLHVSNLHWIVVEDSTVRTDLVTNFLLTTGLTYTHLNIRTPSTVQTQNNKTTNKKESKRPLRGVYQRNLGLKWLRDNVDPHEKPGVVYFMDDDNTYHRKLFDEMRSTRRVSVWRVGLIGPRWEGPIVEKGKVVRFHTSWRDDRYIPIDMAGFAVSLQYLLKEKKNVVFDANGRTGHMETAFLSKLTTIAQLEPKADNCTKIYVWHTRTETPKEAGKTLNSIDLSTEV